MSNELERQKCGGGRESAEAPSPLTNSPALPGPECPGPEEWSLYEAALLPESRAVEMTDHAAVCDACGALLADLHAGDKTGDDAASLELKSSTEAWKQQTIARIAAAQNGTRPAKVVAFPRLPRAWIALAAALTVTAGLGTWWMLRQSSSAHAFQLLAQAYTEQRPFEYRIPGAAHRPVQVRRGGDLVAPEPLTEAQALIARGLRAKPDSPEWIYAQAEASLLTGRYQAAIDALGGAQQTRASDPSSLSDLAIAYLERADAESTPRDIGAALDLLRKALSLRPSDAALHFNLALAYEKQFSFRAAVDAWEACLKIEPNGPWAGEAKDHLERVRRALKAQHARAGAPLAAEDAILPLARRGFTQASDVNPEAVAERLAAEHADIWMKDFLAASHAPASFRAMDLLTRASRATAAGDDSTGQALWTAAAQAFARAGNSPGSAFARLEEAYEYQRLSRAVECQEAANRALADARRSHYIWIEVQTQLRLGVCVGLMGHFDREFQAFETAEKTARESHFQTLALEALGFEASTLRLVGSYSESVRLNAAGLRRYWAGEGDNARAYQFYYSMASAYADAHASESAAVSMREAVSLAATLPNRPVEGMVRARYAETLLENRQIREAEAEFNRSADVLKSLANSKAIDLYRARAGLSAAALDIEENHLAAGTKRLQALESQIPAIQNSVVEATFWSVKAGLLAKAGLTDESDAALDRLLRIAESESHKVVFGDPSAIAREVQAALGHLTDRLLTQGNPAGALNLWSTYNACCRNLTALSNGDRRIVYADLPSGIAVWVTGPGGLQWRRVATPANTLVQRAAIFNRAIADPASSMASVRDLARQLYVDLIGPIEDLIQGGDELQVSVDPSFLALPFGALLQQNGSWLADRYRIVYALPLPAGARTTAPSTGPALSNILAVGAGKPAHVMNEILPSLPGIDDEVESAATAFRDRTVLTGNAATTSAVTGALAKAEVFHFSGHALVTASNSALILAPDGTAASDEPAWWISRLPPGEIAKLFSKCRLVVLAACSTGRARRDADPSSMMARTFLLAGVPQVIAARWDVDSRATGTFVRQFYQGLSSRMPPGEALSASTRLLRRRKEYSHPFYWAAFDLFVS